ncbi:MAG: AAA family ATPase, partial [Thiohalomonadaceae bacterium]
AGAHYLAFRQRLQEWGEEPAPETRALAERLCLTAPVQPPAAEARSLERRPATVLSLQFTLQTDDPELLAEASEGPLQACRDILATHGGHVITNPMGGLLAWFGFPHAQEEAPRRALAAALALRDAGARFPGVHLRLGVHCGTLITDGNPAAPDASGLLAATAMRLHEAVNACGEVLASEPVWERASGYFEGENAGELALPGHTPRIGIFRILRPTPARHRLEAAATLTPFQARLGELARLDALWYQTCDGRGATVVLRGEAGVGKSRLVETFRARLQRDGAVTRMLRCDVHAQGTPFHPLVTMLHDQFATADSMDEEVIRYARALLPELTDAPALLLHLLSLPPHPHHPLPALSPAELRLRTTQLLLAILTARCAQNPILLVLEDTHWADPSTLEMLREAAARVPSLPVMLLVTTRAGDELPRVRRRSFHLELAPLPEKAVVAMVAHIAPGLAPTEAARINQVTGGVPLFVEEMARALAQESGAGGVPATLQDLLMTRLDQCGAARPLAQWASVLGNAFPEALLRAIAPAPGASFDAQLEHLQHQGLLVADQQGGKPIWRFRHALLQEAAYASFARSARSEAHRHVADTLLEHFREDIDARPELVAHHLGECGETERAVRWWMKAGKKTEQRCAHLEAIGHYNRGLTLLATLPPGLGRDRIELELRTALGTNLVSSYGYGAQPVVENYELAIALAGEIGDQDQLFNSLWGLWHTSSSQAGYRAALKLAGRILDLAGRSGRADHRLLAHYALGNNLFCLGEFKAARAELEQAAALAGRVNGEALIREFGEDLRVTTLCFLSWTLCFLGETQAAWACSRESVALARRHDHARTLAFALTFAIKLGWYEGTGGQDELVDELLGLAERYGFAFWQATGMLMHARRLAAAGDAQAAVILTALLDAVKESMAGAEVFFLVGLVECQMALDQREQTLATVARCLEASQLSGNMHYDAELHRIRGEMLLRLSPAQRHEAESCFRRALDIAGQQGAHLLMRRAHDSLARLRAREPEPAGPAA